MVRSKLLQPIWYLFLYQFLHLVIQFPLSWIWNSLNWYICVILHQKRAIHQVEGKLDQMDCPQIHQLKKFSHMLILSTTNMIDFFYQSFFLVLPMLFCFWPFWLLYQKLECLKTLDYNYNKFEVRRYTLQGILPYPTGLV